MPTDNLKTWPERIYLQVHDDDDELPPYNEMYNDGVTWCADQVFMCEVPYIRADLVALPTVEEVAVVVRASYSATIPANEKLVDYITAAVFALLEKSR